MNDEALNRLLKKARKAAPRDTSREEFGFETRLAARLRDRQPAAASWLFWSWAPLPIFAVIALAMVWNAWQTASDREFDIRSAMESGSVEWACVEAITGSAL